MLRSFLLTFRQFISNDEPIFVNKIHNVLWEDVRSDELKGYMADASRKWKQASKVGAIQIATEEGPIDPADLMDIWINGWYFHADTRKETAVQHLMACGIPMAKHAFLNHVMDGTNYVFFLAQTIVVARRGGLLD